MIHQKAFEWITACCIMAISGKFALVSNERLTNFQSAISSIALEEK